MLIPDVTALPDIPLKSILAPQGIKSMLSVPLMDVDRCIGFVGIDAVHRQVQFGEAEQEMLKLFAVLLVNIKRRRQAADELDQIAAERRSAYRALQQSEQRYRALFNNSRDALIIIAPPDWEFVTCNRAAVELFGFPDVLTMMQYSLVDLCPEYQTDGRRSDESARHWLEQTMAEGTHFFEWLHLDRQGREFTCAVSLNRSDWSGQTVIQGTVRDITEQKKAEQALKRQSEEMARINRELQRLAHYDTVTRLPNRNLLADRLQLSMHQADRRKLGIAIAYLDLDGFKSINDQYGHDIGDQMLAELAYEMHSTLREGDTIARLGGDEFVAVLVDLPGLEAVHSLMTRLLDAAASVVEVQGMQLQVSASAGVTFYPQSEPIDADQLLRQADQAMYQAKLAGRSQFSLFDTVRDKALKGQQARIEDVREALQKDQFRLQYQPKVNMRTGEVIGVEALIRWQHPKDGWLLPGEFLPLLQDHPLSIELDDWVLAQAITQMQAWHKQGLPLTVSINLCAMQIQQPDFMTKLRAQMKRCKAGRVELEIVESSALDDINQVSEIIDACSELGVRVALDDFGTGYSSLTYLRRLPAQILKIDHSFVRDMLDDRGDLAILEGILVLASAFDREVVAEGVETEAHGVRLLELGCELAQGFGIARPMAAENLAAWIKSWQPPQSWLNQER
ncbi:MAG: EAL domain-containing protein [Natronospirillum sp.]|uniref:sensor domain-containing phosphodiesterase n=1 Tax=Natronospirillum sp. TaxID=2812955 RepID=UPI0025E81A20|nr:EAL domain-containing protein [Natronospirillum sp.]MCH8552471.1 EAL domain-containing protein [Natronospirillum sp.]